MIKIQELEQTREAFYLLAKVIDFPVNEILSSDFLEECHRDYPQTPERERFLLLLEELQKKPLLELKEDYSRLFELNKRITLYMSYARFEDSRERGTLLAKLKMVYEMFGAELESSELTDYLPVMLEFLAVGDWQGDPRSNDLILLFSIMEDGTYKLLEHAKEHEEELYIQLVRLIRSELKSCMEIKEVRR